MMPHPLFYWFCCSVLLIGFSVQAQNEDKGLSEQLVVKKYMESAYNKAALYTGKMQTPYPRTVINHPYYGKGLYSPGDIYYDGIFYPNVHMRLDIYREELIILSPDTLYNIVLDANRIGYAIIQGQRVEYMTFDNSRNIPLTGFYTILYNGNLATVLKKESAIQKGKEKSGIIVYEFERLKNYYIIINNVFSPVKNKKSLLKVLESHKRELDSYIKLYKLDFKNSFDESLISVVKKYEELTLTHE